MVCIIINTSLHDSAKHLHFTAGMADNLLVHTLGSEMAYSVILAKHTRCGMTSVSAMHMQMMYHLSGGTVKNIPWDGTIVVAYISNSMGFLGRKL